MPTVPERGREFRVLNLKVALIVSLGLVAWYFYRGSRNSMSDNVGVLVVPWVALFIYFPLASVLSGLVELAFIPRGHSAGSVLRRFGNTQPILVKVLGLFGGIALLYALLSGGWCGVYGVLFSLF